MTEQAPAGRIRYRTFTYDSARWDHVPLRTDDVIISTPAKCGTTWMQMICALLVLQDPELPRPLTELSPWIDMNTMALPDLVALVEAQEHRRFLKSHTPLDGLPAAPGITYVCVGRDPRDVALSWDRHFANTRLDRLVEIRAAAVGLDDLAELGIEGLPDPPPEALEDRLAAWIDDDDEPAAGNGGLWSVLHHLGTCWARRDDPQVALFHYADLEADLEGEMRRLADVLGIDVPAERWPDLVSAADFAAMRERAEQLAPESTKDLWHDPSGFFAHGRSGGWRDAFTDDLVERYAARAAALAPPDLLAWVHEGSRARRSDRP